MTTPCRLEGCTEYGRPDHHHHILVGVTLTYACHCTHGEPR